MNLLRRVARLLVWIELSLVSVATHAAEPTAHRLIVGWDDSVICCGPGTDAGMDSPLAVERMVKRWKARGYDGIYWRVDEAMLPERFMTRWETTHSPGMNYLLERVDQELHEFPVLKTLMNAAEREGLEIWAWYPTIYSNGAPPTGPGFTTGWLYENKFGTDHQEILTVDRAGNKQYMVWEYAYPEARRAKVSEFVQFAKDYGFKRFVACLRTEAAQNQPAPKHADQFGFNAPVVAEMQKLHGVDIMTDPRFDYTDAKYNVHDPLLEEWRKLRGGYLTQFYRELRAGLNEVDPTIQIAVQIPGDRAGTCLGNWPIEWRTWIDEGLVNELVVPVVLDQYEGYGASAQPEDFGYIPAAVTVETVREFIKTSRQPTARVVQAGGPSTGYQTPPAGANGWRLDSWPDLWTYNMAERWEQWHRDLAEFGHIRFIEQNFDGFPIGTNGYGGGFGDFCYRPDLRHGPGYWETIGAGQDELPFTQSQIRHGDTGQAIQLTRKADGSANLSARHHGRHDRSLFPFPGDTAISSGVADCEYWLYRPDEKSSLVSYIQYDVETANRNEIGLYITEGSPAGIYYRAGGTNVASQATMGTGGWHRVAVHVDLEQKVYTATITPEGGATQTICTDVAYTSKSNALNMIDFSPQGQPGSVFYLDDVAIRWTPSVIFEAPGEQVLLEAGFEADEKQPLAQLTIAGTDITVDHDISYGSEYQSLRFRGAGGSASLTAPDLRWPTNGTLRVDLDLLPKSDLPYLQITPSPTATSQDEIRIALRPATGGEPILELHSKDGRWHIMHDSKTTDTGQSVAWDAWLHLQVVIDSSAREWRILSQVMGEAPRPLSQGRLVTNTLPKSPLSVEMTCQRPAARADGPALDNVRVTRQKD